MVPRAVGERGAAELLVREVRGEAEVTAGEALNPGKDEAGGGEDDEAGGSAGAGGKRGVDEMVDEIDPNECGKVTFSQCVTVLADELGKLASVEGGEEA